MDRGVMSWLWSDVEEYLLKVGYPPSLAKACTDDCFYYAMCLKNGVIIEFEGAVENGEWIPRCIGVGGASWLLLGF